MIDFLENVKNEIPFAIISRSSEDDFLEYINGNLFEYSKVSEILNQSSKSLNIFPFCQIKERRFKSHGDEKIISIEIKNEIKINKNDFINSVTEIKNEIDAKIFYNISDEDFKKKVNDIIENEIKNGEGSNFVLSRYASGEIKNFTINNALSIFKNLLVKEYGYYWSYFIYTGRQYFIGASPEMHLNIEKNNVKMNPISGTFRKSENLISDIKKLNEFLLNQKEIYELFIVTDEEVKVMSKICKDNIKISGPYLKEMSSVIHTEYIVTGEGQFNIKKTIINSMQAATLIGGPIENACKIIKKYENESRRYYCGALLLIDNKAKNFKLDGVTIIRTAEINLNGSYRIQSGSTIVYDSNPENELEEIISKSKALFNSFFNKKYEEKYKILQSINNETLKNLKNRNENLSDFWLKSYSVKKFSKKHKSFIINNEDEFTNMLIKILQNMNIDIIIRSYKDINYNEIENSDFIIIGPGPGNPNDDNLEKVIINNKIISKYFGIKKILGICFGHQLISKYIGLEIKKGKKISQGIALNYNIFGKDYKVGFYNTFFAKYNEEIINKFNIEYSINEHKEIIAMRNKDFVSFQFHPESIITINGCDLIFEAINKLLLEN